jgi:hypothetical protein
MSDVRSHGKKPKKKKKKKKTPFCVHYRRSTLQHSLYILFVKYDEIFKNKKTRGVSHGGLAIYINFKKYLKAKKQELWKLKYFTMQKNYYNLSNNPLKETQKNSFKILLLLL